MALNVDRLIGGLLAKRLGVETHTLPDASVLLVDNVSGTAIPVSESAGRVWEMCDGAHTLDQIVDRLAAIYEAERTDIYRDTEEFLAVLTQHQFVERQSS